ncbi:serine/threonine-protein kinase [Vitiosangium sp. GDMCC 1.1324]|uniref:serine/threonine protein kinase n=1 Tax=Vitiosangium sp. (strain GDMCC 1.1324) TaxID=2138576 RepID=UPI00130E9871|nr:serine/threonine-protein kinase [Vitiosangium sp. GDMCC 1.1324]
MNSPQRPHHLVEGDLVRDFRILQLLGMGGFSFVFLVERGGRRFTMKMAARPASPADEDRVDAWMRRETASLEHLEHPNLLPVLEWGRWPDPETGHGYFVTPHVYGSTFHTWRWNVRAPLQRSLGVLCEQLKVLEVLHERGVCHRDIKADNLLVQFADDKPFLIDFGSVHLPWARVLTEGLAPGTLYCQPPEAVSFLVSEAARPGSRLEARPAADLYAFGVLLYETLTNCRPFSSRLPLDQLLIAIATMAPPDPRTLDPGLPMELCELTLRLLEKDPNKRPVDARTVRTELERLRAKDGLTSAWRTPTRRPSECRWTLELPAGVEPLEEPKEEAPMRPSAPRAPPSEQVRAPEGSSRRKRTWPWFLAAVALTVGLLAIGWALLRVVSPPSREECVRAEPTAPAPPAPPFKGTQPVPSFPSFIDCPDSILVPSRACALFTTLLSVFAAQLAGCATAPVRPDPAGYLAHCSPEARATPVELDIKPDEQATFLDSGTPASDVSILDGGSLNLKSGPVNATMYVMVKGKEVELKISGEAIATPNRVYMQFDRVYLPDGTSRPICGVAVDGVHEYGIPTYARLPIRGAKVDPARVDPSPGSVVLNDPRFETVLQGPEGYYVPRINMAPPDWR